MMKPIKLTIEGRTFLIEENERGDPQIRAAGAAIIARDDRALVHLENLGGLALLVKVERA